MGSLSVSTHRGVVHWQGLLLVVSLLNFWSQPTAAQVTVESISTLEGKDAILCIQHNATNVTAIMWFREDTTNTYRKIAYLIVDRRMHIRGPLGAQVMVNYDGSLVLKNVTTKDAGMYTVVVQLQGCQSMVGCGQLNVYPHMSVPTLLASNTTVTENKDAVVMNCYTKAPTIQWLFNGTNLHPTERIKLFPVHRLLIIDPVQREDAGYYQCKVFNPLSSAESAYLALDVKFQ